MKSNIGKVVTSSAMILALASTQTITYTEASEKGASQDEHTIMHTNDIHGHFLSEEGEVIGMPKLKTMKEQVKPDLMVSAGDTFQGYAPSDATEGREMVKAFNQIGYDAITPGNHEFDFGFDRLMEIKNNINAPMISTNVYKDGKRPFKPSTIVNKNDVDYGIVGVTSDETENLTRLDSLEGVEFKDPVQSATEEIKNIQDQSDVIVVLSHLGVNDTSEKAERGDHLLKALTDNPEIKKPVYVIDSHSHTVLKNGEYYKGNPLVQTGKWLSNVGLIDFDFKNDQATNPEASLIPEAETRDIKPNKKLEQQVNKANKAFLKEASEVLVKGNEVLFEKPEDKGFSHETNLGNAIADSMEDVKFKEPTDFAFMTSGSIQKNIEPGDITKKDVLDVMPYGSSSVLQMDVKGSTVKEAFEHSLDADVHNILDNPKLKSSGSFLQISKSIRVKYDASKPSGERVNQIEVLNKETNTFEPLNLERTYKVATDDFTARGGGGYDMFERNFKEGKSMNEAFMDYLKKGQLDQYETTVAERSISIHDDAAMKQAQDKTLPESGEHVTPWFVGASAFLLIAGMSMVALSRRQSTK
ncbi:5'-nucleotidase C-terminal domain-containing protein [Staphylococcus massiliensis]|uniref:Virulence-associated cell-wall-anchored protein n=1 Tax=Staphylococcus massiliensis S46 TaxID=1229783 RepID=K9AHS7_9STAP|nr:5'-nucleotidase C-terminal domain-containing protein [Staphylococcus massiliensis]EKU46824.1 Virulence-associated cell-wall-anchored protein [Staphylococcus massiliensis S46]POA01564.1 bifunctional metallophosphatase/5'-nucleotidase [Staphylococcus massiliensis CCUG 55927]